MSRTNTMLALLLCAPLYAKPAMAGDPGEPSEVPAAPARVVPATSQPLFSTASVRSVPCSQAERSATPVSCGLRGDAFAGSLGVVLPNDRRTAEQRQLHFKAARVAEVTFVTLTVVSLIATAVWASDSKLSFF